MSGFVLKDAPPEKTLEAIHVVARRDAFIAPAGEDDGAHRKPSRLWRYSRGERLASERAAVA